MVRATAVAALCERRAFFFDIANSAVTDRHYRTNLRAVAADCLDRATFHRLFAQGFFLGRFGLLINVGMAAVIVATEVRGSGFTAQVAVNALVIDIELSVDIFGIFICGVSHFFKASGEASGSLG